MKITSIIMAIIIAGMLTGCASSVKLPAESNEQSQVNDFTKEVEYRKINAEEAKDMMAYSSDYVLLDVRTEEEFREKRLDGALLIPDYEIGDRAENELFDKDALILIYCRSGRRSALAAEELLLLGYTNVYDFGGIIDWTYETVSGD